MLTKQLEQLFKAYRSAFIDYDYQWVRRCYKLPCTLSTPDKLVLLDNNESFELEFEQIFSQLRLANMSEIKAQKASYSQVHDGLVVAAIDWQFFDQNEAFTEFTALYHITKYQDNWVITNVVSHDINQSVDLSEKLIIE